MIKSALKVVAFTVPATLTLFDTCGCVSRVEGSSMRPLINAQYKETNYVFLNRWGHKNYDFSRGQVVCLTCPTDPKQKILKRIIALEGDTIKTLNYKEKHVTIPKGYCWVEGDNHKQSLDSNLFGPVPVGLITSRATHIVWPPNKIQSIPIIDVADRIKKHDRPESMVPTSFDVPTHYQNEKHFISCVKTKNVRIVGHKDLVHLNYADNTTIAKNNNNDNNNNKDNINKDNNNKDNNNKDNDNKGNKNC